MNAIRFGFVPGIRVSLDRSAVQSSAKPIASAVSVPMTVSSSRSAWTALPGATGIRPAINSAFDCGCRDRRSGSA